MTIRNYLTLLWLLLIAACGSAGLAPESFSERLAAAYGMVTAVREASTSAANAGTLTVNDMEQSIKFADDARSALDAAKAASEVGNMTTAEGKLALAANVLATVQTYLRSKGVKTSCVWIGGMSWA